MYLLITFSQLVKFLWVLGRRCTLLVSGWRNLFDGDGGSAFSEAKYTYISRRAIDVLFGTTTGAFYIILPGAVEDAPQLRGRRFS